MRSRRRPPRLLRPGHVLVAIPLALIALIVTVDLAPEPDIHLGPLLIVAPAITASFAGPWLVAAVGVLAVAGEVVTSLSVAEKDRNAQIAAVVLVSAFIVFYSLLRERRGRELSQVRSVADAVQRVLMRPLPERIGPLRIASLYLTAEREAQVGGDLYAAARINAGTRLIIGDVRGKGLTAIDTTAQVLGSGPPSISGPRSRTCSSSWTMSPASSPHGRTSRTPASRSASSPRRCWTSPTATPWSTSSTVGTRRRCSSTTARSRSCRRATPRLRWAWARSRRPGTTSTPSRSRPATSCCSTPTA